MDALFEGESPRARLALLLQHFAKLEDNREPWRIVYPLREVLLLVTCASIASCDDFDDIVAWGKHHLHFLRQFSEFHHGMPRERWLRSLMNRIDPDLFGRCFKSWVASLWPGRHDFIAIDGKTARRTHDRRKGLKALHTLSAYATTARLVLAQTCVPEKTNEITAIPDLLDELAETGQLEGALVTIDAMGCQVEIADKIVAHKADYLLALKGNQPTLETDVEDYFRTAPATKLVSKTTLEKGHTVESRRASIPPPPKLIGLPLNAAIQGHPASPASRPCSRSARAPNMPIAAASIPVSISPRRLSTSSASPARHGAIGGSRACTGSSMSSSRMICRATVPAMAPKTWLSSGASHSISCAPIRTKEASKPVASARVGAPNSC
jgi:predicted transposase YbfD/YdcC